MSASLKRRLLAAVCSASFASFAVGPAVTEADTPQPVIWCAANLGSDTESTSDSGHRHDAPRGAFVRFARKR
jgi:hypothetical protein